MVKTKFIGTSFAILIAVCAYILLFGVTVSAEDASPDSLSTEYTEAYWNARRIPIHLDLAVERDGRQYYISRNDYNAMDTTTRNSLNKLGVVVIGTGNYFRTNERFILGLEDINSNISWIDAVGRYQSQMPSKEQGDVWGSHHEEIGEAVRAFGGQHVRKGANIVYWTKSERGSFGAWVIFFGNGHVLGIGKSASHHVRPVVTLSPM